MRPNLNIKDIMEQTKQVMAQNNKIAGLVANALKKKTDQFRAKQKTGERID